MSVEFTGQVRFEAFVLDVKHCELRRNGVHVPLQRQPCKLLAWLVLHANQVVSREQLRQQIWSNRTFVDFDAGLNFCVGQIRRALGEDARRPRLLETLHSRGYRFIGKAEVVTVTPAPLPVPRESRRITIAISPELEEGPVFTRLADGLTSLLLSCIGAGDWTPVVCSAMDEVRINHGPLDTRYLALMRLE